jgi:cation diffusion facilitator CzcD-associated flavoprotein CzcO
VPQIAPLVDKLHYFQRTAPWVVPKEDRPLTDRERQDFASNPWRQRMERVKQYWLMELRFLAFKFKPEWMGLVAKVAKHKIRQAVKDEALQAKLTPDYTPGCKRLLISNEYYPALARTNVNVITDGIREITATGVVTQDGVERKVDAIVFGTGFKVSDPIPPKTVFGKGGRDLHEVWKDGPEAYMGINVAGFPNFFILMGPNTGLGHNSMVFMIESQVHYVLEAIKAMKERGIRALDVKPQAQQQFIDGVQDELKSTVWNSGCKSWYLNDKGRNVSLWPGFTFAYRWKTRNFKLSKYTVQPAVKPTAPASSHH